MEIKLTLKFEKEELGEMKEVLEAIEGTVTIPVEQLDLEPIEQAALRAVRDDPGRAARTVHRKAAEYDECPVEWVDENSPEREAIKEALHSLGDRGFVELEERSWYPAG